MPTPLNAPSTYPLALRVARMLVDYSQAFLVHAKLLRMRTAVNMCHIAGRGRDLPGVDRHDKEIHKSHRMNSADAKGYIQFLSNSKPIHTQQA